MPASLIALRAFGLALIAAAAAARPAASISLLIAALASLSTVVLLELFELEDDFDDPLRVLDFAIANLPSVAFRRLRLTTVPLRRRKGKGNLRIRGANVPNVRTDGGDARGAANFRLDRARQIRGRSRG